MSFDELLPDSESPRSTNEGTPGSAQDPSVQDAPPDGTTRRRRATRTGTDAASTAPTAELNPQRKRRSRTKVIPSESVEPASNAELTSNSKSPNGLGGGPERAGPIGEASGASEVTSPTVSDASPVRRSRRTRAAPTPTESQPEPPGESPTARRNPRSRAPVRTKSAEESDAGEPRNATPSSPTSVRRRQPKIEPDAVPPADIDETPAAAPKPRKRGRGKRSAAPSESAVQAVEPSESPTEEAAEQDAQSPGTAEPTTARPPRSHRTRGRSKREGTRIDQPEAEPGVEAPGSAPAIPAPVIRKWIDRSIGSHLIVRNGIPRITINDVTYPPIVFFGNLDASGDRSRVLSEMRRAARAGVHLHSILVELPCPLSEATEALDAIDVALRAVLDADPDGYVMPRIVFVPARGWKREYPTDIATYADGTTGDPSLTSERFWREAEHSLATLISHLRDYEWSSRIFGYHLERGEWFQPEDLGYDRSMANREAFRDWLREKYNNSLVALRAAWYDGNVQFHTAEIPTVVSKPNPQRAFFETRRERRTIDFFAFTSESTAKRLESLAAAIKLAADDQSLVSVCYGYTFEFGHGFSGHLALGRLLECPDIDLICGPPSYRDRKPGGAASMPAPTDSLRLHGKLWLSEDDTKTFLAPAQQDPDDFNPRLATRFDTEQAHSRAMGRAVATETGLGFMDLWGEGWLDDDGLWDRIAAFTLEYPNLAEGQVGNRVDLVVLIDEKSLLHIQRGEPFFRKVTAGIRELLQRGGISYEIYLQSDLLHPEFPRDAKLYLFANPYRLTTEQRAAIAEKLQGAGRTLAWMFAPGACEERPQIGGAMEETATGAVGLTLRQQEWNSEIGSRIVEQRHPITERISAKEIGIRERLNPSFYVDDPDATVLAEYQGSGLPSIAVKRCGNWQTVFIGEPALTWELLRGICKFAGVHLWTGGEDVAFIRNGLVVIHASRDGNRAVRLPEPMAVYDLTERRLAAQETREHRLFLRSGTTHTLCIGSVARFRDLGLPNVAAADGGPSRAAAVRPIEPDPITAPVAEIADATTTLSEDMLTLKAVLNMDLSQVADLTFEEAEDRATPIEVLNPFSDPAEAEARLAALLPDIDVTSPARRRRRRGGRGRGRKRGDSVDGATDSSDVTSEGAAAEPGSSEVAAPVHGGRPTVEVPNLDESLVGSELATATAIAAGGDPDGGDAS